MEVVFEGMIDCCVVLFVNYGLIVGVNNIKMVFIVVEEIEFCV